MKAPSISVVIPAYGRPAALLRAVDSVDATDLRDVEIIVVDDASPQSLASVVPASNRHGVPVRYYRLLHNCGPQAARNLGIRRAKFDYIAFLDSDDEFAPTKLDVVRRHLAAGNYDLIFHAVEGLPTYARIGRWWNLHLRSVLPFDWLIVLLNPVVTPSLIVKRENKLGLARLRHAEDWAYLMRVVRPGMAVAYLDEPLSRVYRPLGSAGGQSSALWLMRKGEFQGRALLLRQAGVRSHMRYALGTLIGCTRIAWDLARRRYGPLGQRSTDN